MCAARQRNCHALSDQYVLFFSLPLAICNTHRSCVQMLKLETSSYDVHPGTQLSSALGNSSASYTVDAAFSIYIYDRSYYIPGVVRGSVSRLLGRFSRTKDKPNCNIKRIKAPPLMERCCINLTTRMPWTQSEGFRRSYIRAEGIRCIWHHHQYKHIHLQETCTLNKGYYLMDPGMPVCTLRVTSTLSTTHGAARLRGWRWRGAHQPIADMKYKRYRSIPSHSRQCIASLSLDGWL